jgi:hypothetical protein
VFVLHCISTDYISRKYVKMIIFTGILVVTEKYNEILSHLI